MIKNTINYIITSNKLYTDKIIPLYNIYKNNEDVMPILRKIIKNRINKSKSIVNILLSDNNLKIDFINEFLVKDYYFTILYSEGAPLEFIENHIRRHKRIEIDWKRLKSKYITEEFISRYHNKGIKFWLIHNYDFSLKFIEKNINKKWDPKILAKNKNLNEDFVSMYIDRMDTRYLNFTNLSPNFIKNLQSKINYEKYNWKELDNINDEMAYTICELISGLSMNVCVEFMDNISKNCNISQNIIDKITTKFNYMILYLRYISKLEIDKIERAYVSYRFNKISCNKHMSFDIYEKYKNELNFYEILNHNNIITKEMLMEKLEKSKKHLNKEKIYSIINYMHKLDLNKAETNKILNLCSNYVNIDILLSEYFINDYKKSILENGTNLNSDIIDNIFRFN